MTQTQHQVNPQTNLNGMFNHNNHNLNNHNLFIKASIYTKNKNRSPLQNPNNNAPNVLNHNLYKRLGSGAGTGAVGTSNNSNENIAINQPLLQVHISQPHQQQVLQNSALQHIHQVQHPFIPQNQTKNNTSKEIRRIKNHKLPSMIPNIKTTQEKEPDKQERLKDQERQKKK